MDISKLMQSLKDAGTESEKKQIEEEIKSQFASLNDSEKELVKKEFMNSLDEELEKTQKALEKIDLKIEMLEVSQYISLSKVAKNY
jgi:hypothetical protein